MELITILCIARVHTSLVVCGANSERSSTLRPKNALLKRFLNGLSNPVIPVILI
nr:hypothetical protein [Ruminococcus bromii]